ncbi:MAG: hypothetical protein ABIZ56_10475 [Chthoniobacteraceae bacterium]
MLPALLILAGCDAAPPVAPVLPPPVEISRPAAGKTAGDLSQRQVAFLNRLREADPQQRTIDRALLNEQNELGLIMDRSVEMDKIPALMKTMLAQMAREFPGQDLTVIAYAPSTPPRKIGTARLNAQTRDMTYTPER